MKSWFREINLISSTSYTPYFRFETGVEVNTAIVIHVTVDKITDGLKCYLQGNSFEVSPCHR